MKKNHYYSKLFLTMINSMMTSKPEQGCELICKSKMRFLAFLTYNGFTMCSLRCNTYRHDNSTNKNGKITGTYSPDFYLVLLSSVEV